MQARTGLTVAVLFLGLFLFIPLASVFYEALRKGVDTYLAALTEPDAVSAIKLTLTVAAIAVPLNVVFGVAAAWAIARSSSVDHSTRRSTATAVGAPAERPRPTSGGRRPPRGLSRLWVDASDHNDDRVCAVSYTHLTLPTSDLV